MTIRHRAYYDGGSRYVYWDAPEWDPNGQYWDGPPQFSELSQIRVIQDDAVTTKSRPQQTGYQLTDGSNGPTSSPVGSGDTVGANISTIPDINLYWILRNASSGTQSTVRVWLYDGSEWVPYQTFDLSNSENRASLDSFQLEGGWSRIYVQITSAPSSGTLDAYVTPHNESPLT